MAPNIPARNTDAAVEFERGANTCTDAQGRADTKPSDVSVEVAEANDYFVEKDGLRYAGTQLLVDLWDARGLDDATVVETALMQSVDACNATLLGLELHRFNESGGISGVAVLAESHISIHTWPERGYAAVDIFMCGACDPYMAIPVLRRHFEPRSVQLCEQKRGLVE